MNQIIDADREISVRAAKMPCGSPIAGGIENTLLYASVSRGFKSGAFQGQLSFDPAALQPFDDEKVLAYEAGMKTQRLGNSLELNASVFFYDYEDMQFYGGLFDSPVGVLFGITNVGNAEVKGVEADLWWRRNRQRAAERVGAHL